MDKNRKNGLNSRQVPPKRVSSLTEQDFKDVNLRSSTVLVKDFATSNAYYPNLLGCLAKEVLENLERYEELFEKAKKVSAGLCVDLIMQIHGPAPDEKKDIVMESQAGVCQALTLGKYDLVAVEGIGIDPVTIEGLAWAIVNHCRKYNFPECSIEQARAMVESSLPMEGGVQYLRKNPRALVIGSEDDPLNGLHMCMINQIQMDMDSHLNKSVRGLRDEVAIAKIILKLRQVKGKKGAIVLGYNHQDNVIELLKCLHVTGDVFETNQTR